jgi:hypothetical protein
VVEGGVSVSVSLNGLVMKLEAFQQNFAEDQQNQLVYFLSSTFLRCNSKNIFSNMVGFTHLLSNKLGKGVEAMLLVTVVNILF